MKRVEIRTLRCGVRVAMEKISHVQSAAIGIWVKNGSVDETPEVAGISHFIEHMMFKGTQKRNARQIAEDVDKLGGQMNAFTSKEATCYYVKTINTHLLSGADVLLDMVSNSIFDAREMTKERKVIYEEIKMIEDQPDDLCHDKVTEMVFKGTPLGNSIIGNKTSLARITRNVILEYKNRAYTRDSIVVSVAGNFDEDVICEFLEDKFEKLSATKEKRTYQSADYVPTFKVIQKDILQSHLCMATKGVSLDDPRYYTFSVLNNIMGGSMSSRFFQNIREEKGLAYSVYSMNSSYSTDGCFNIYAGISHDKIEEAIEGIKEELDVLDRKGVTDEELYMSKEQLKANYIFGQENVASRMFAIGKNLLLLNKVFTADEVIEGIDNVSKESIDEIKPILCNPANYCASCVTDRKFNLKKIINS